MHKRQQRPQALTSNMAYTLLERQLAAVKTTKMELEAKLREKEVVQRPRSLIYSLIE